MLVDCTGIVELRVDYLGDLGSNVIGVEAQVGHWAYQTVNHVVICNLLKNSRGSPRALLIDSVVRLHAASSRSIDRFVSHPDTSGIFLIWQMHFC